MYVVYKSASTEWFKEDQAFSPSFLGSLPLPPTPSVFLFVAGRA